MKKAKSVVTFLTATLVLFGVPTISFAQDDNFACLTNDSLKRTHKK